MQEPQSQLSYNYLIEGVRQDICYVGKTSTPEMYACLKQDGDLRFQIVGCGNYGQNDFRVCLRMVQVPQEMDKPTTAIAKVQDSNAPRKNHRECKVWKQVVLDEAAGMSEKECRDIVERYDERFFSSGAFYQLVDSMSGQYPAILEDINVLRKFGKVEKVASVFVLRPDQRILCVKEADGSLSLPSVALEKRDNVAHRLDEAVYNATGIEIQNIRVSPQQVLPDLRKDFVGVVAEMAASTPEELRTNHENFVWVPKEHLSTRLNPLGCAFAEAIQRSSLPVLATSPFPVDRLLANNDLG